MTSFYRRFFRSLFLPVLLMAVRTEANGQADAVTIYVSKQTGQSSRFEGNHSKQTDQFEQGTVEFSVDGPLIYSINPNTLNIQPNQNKTWTGSISADVNGAPPPGSSTPAQLVANYNIIYSRPYGEGTEGTVTSTYYCSKDGSAAGEGGCAFHDHSPGPHEMVQQTGIQSKNFEIVSILADIPDTLCLGATGQGNVTVTSYPAIGGRYMWTSTNPKVQITNADQKTPTIRLTDTTVKNASIKVKFEIGGVTYEDVAILSICECACKPIANGITAGPLQLNFSAPPDAPLPNEQGNCTYTANNASFTFNMNGIIQRTVNVPGNATVKFGRNCQSGDLGEVSVDWEGDIDIPEVEINGVKVIKLNVKKLSLMVAKSGNLSGSVTINASNPEDRDLTLGKGFVMLRQGLNSDITFNFDNQNGFAGRFDFSGLHGIKIDLVKKSEGQDVVIADFTGDMSAEGVLAGNVDAKVNASYKTNLFKVTVKELTLGLELKVQTGNFKLTHGNGKVEVSEMKAVTGAVTLGLNFPGNGICNATVQASDIKAFTMTLSDFNLQADFNSDFDMTKVNGSLKAKHDKFDAKLNVEEFAVESGSLKTFRASGQVKYSAFKFTLEDATYSSSPSELSVTAKVELNATGTQAMVNVKDFKIAEDGTITVGNIQGSFARAPASFNFNATFEQNKFKGSFNGDFASIGLDGTIDIGSEEQPEYNYAYFSIAARANVPLGQSGLKLTQVSGKAGFNYELVFPGGNGQPSKGSYIIGMGLGVADMANMCQVTGEAVVQFNTYSGNTVLTLNGTIDVLKNNTFFSGNMNVNYRIPQQTIDGRVGAVVKIPSSGSVITTNNCQVDFNIGNGSWHASGNNMSGQMFDGIVQLSGGFINMSGSTANAGAMSGSLGGRASAVFNYSLSVSALGNEVTGDIALNLNSQINASINQNGLAGSFAVHVTGNGILKVETWFGTSTFNGSAVANGNVSYNGSSMSMNGNMDVTLPVTIPFWGNQISTGFSLTI